MEAFSDEHKDMRQNTISLLFEFWIYIILNDFEGLMKDKKKKLFSTEESNDIKATFAQLKQLYNQN